MRHAIVSGITVVNVTTGESLDPTWIQCDSSVGIGHTYDPDTGVFTAPIVEPVPEPTLTASRIISHLDYMGRFTDPELETIYSLEATVPAIKVWLKKFEASADINLDDPRTIAGLQSMEASGLLAAGRANEILA